MQPQSDAGLEAHGSAPRSQADACTALMTQTRLSGPPQSQNRLRNGLKPSFCPSPALGVSWLCRVSCSSRCLLRADRSHTCILHQEQALGSDWESKALEQTGISTESIPVLTPICSLHQRWSLYSNKVAACQAAARPESQNLGLGMLYVPRVKIPCLSQVRDCHHRQNGSNTTEKPTLWPR